MTEYSNTDTLNKMIDSIAKSSQFSKIQTSLQKSFTDFTAAEIICEYLTYSSKHYQINSVQHFVDETHSDYYDVVSFLKFLDKLGLGNFIVGRKGKDSRIEWKFCPMQIGQFAKGKIPTIGKVSKDLDLYDGGDKKLGVIPHSFFLRPDFQVKVELPEDFNETDVNRFHNWLTTIPF